ncbi:MAG: BlaI/MecI/CopY family transcriptional regulator [Anaerolineae bacterium]|nr:BlaI/MecI/CopY family transcriptional regulator [Anaerolineae bacterium]
MDTNKNQDTQTVNNGVGSPPVRTQFLIFTLFGEYILERGGKVWTSDLLALMGLLDVSERAVRSALSRMTRKGWITTHKQGRRSQYSLTARGQALLERGHSRIFEPIITDWDGQWHLVVYSLPEEQRNTRHALRTQLAWLGYGSLAPGTWISAHDRADELSITIVELGIESFVEMFSGTFQGNSSIQDLVNRCWDLPALEAQYQDFMTAFQPEYMECRGGGNGKESLDPQTCFVRLFWLTHQFQSFPLKDPNLPTSLLPADWAGTEARRLFDDYHRLLSRYANQFVDEVIADSEAQAK